MIPIDGAFFMQLQSYQKRLDKKDNKLRKKPEKCILKQKEDIWKLWSCIIEGDTKNTDS